MELGGIVSTTHLDLQGERMTLGALESMARQASLGAIPVMVEHDITVPPLGKLLEARVEPREDGEHQLVARSRLFSSKHSRKVRLPDGTKAWEQYIPGDSRPFVSKVAGDPERTRVEVDRHNFHSDEDLEAFWSELRTEVDVEERYIGRKSLIPDPQVIVTLTVGCAGFFLGLLGKRVATKAADVIGDDIAAEIVNAYEAVKFAAVSMARYAIPKHRPVVYIFRCMGEPQMDFVVRTSNPNQFVGAILEEKLR